MKPLAAVVLMILFVAVIGGQRSALPQTPLKHTQKADYTYGQGYIEAGANGGAYAFGNANFENSVFSVSQPPGQSAQQWWGNAIVGVAALQSNNGYYFASNDTSADDSITCAFGAAQAYEFYPNPGYVPNWCALTWGHVDDIVGIAVDNATGGYWEVGADGGIFNFFGAPFDGSAQPYLSSGTGAAVAMAATPDGNGYWVVTSKGALYAFGDAQNVGQISGNLNCSIVSMAAAQNDSSYWMNGCDGGVFAFGQAAYYGSVSATAKYFNIQAMSSTSDGNGYYVMAFDGSLFTYGDAQFQNALYGNTVYGQIAGVAGTT